MYKNITLVITDSEIIEATKQLVPLMEELDAARKEAYFRCAINRATYQKLDISFTLETLKKIVNKDEICLSRCLREEVEGLDKVHHADMRDDNKLLKSFERLVDKCEELESIFDVGL